MIHNYKAAINSTLTFNWKDCQILVVHHADQITQWTHFSPYISASSIFLPCDVEYIHLNENPVTLICHEFLSHFNTISFLFFPYFHLGPTKLLLWSHVNCLTTPLRPAERRYELKKELVSMMLTYVMQVKSTPYLFSSLWSSLTEWAKDIYYCLC